MANYKPNEPAHTLLTDPDKLIQSISIDENLIQNTLKEVNLITEFDLNPSQAEAFKSTFKKPLTLIWGPPGTGKTDTLSKILIGWLLRKDKKNINILIGSNNYNAIDNLIKKLLEQDDSIDNIFRVRSTGRETLPHKNVIDIDASTKKDRERLFNLLNNSTKNQIVASTWKQLINITKKENEVYHQKWFDLIIIDEASQVPVTNALAYFLLAKKEAHFILAGDPKQLGPIYTYKIEEENYLYDNIFTYYSEKFSIPQEQLTISYRCNNPIIQWPAERFYINNYKSANPTRSLDHQVTCLETKPDDWPENLLWHSSLYTLCNPEHPISILIHDDKVSTLSNTFESDIITSLVYVYNSLYNECEDIFWSKKIGIVTPHRAQVSSIRNNISSTLSFSDEIIAVDSVDKFQGDEREVILSSYSVSDKDFISSEEEFILNSKRFNVTLTRAKSKFILIISQSLIEYISGDLEIAKDASHLQMFITKYCEELETHEIYHNNQAKEQLLKCSIKVKSFKE